MPCPPAFACPPPCTADYNFIRLGKDGLRREYDNLFRIYDHLKSRLEDTGERRKLLPL